MRDPDAECLRRAAADRPLERLADDLVERGLRALAEELGGSDVDLDVDAVLDPLVLRERGDRAREAVVAEHHRLEVEREVAELADRRSRAAQRRLEDLGGALAFAAACEVDGGVEKECDAG